MENCKSAAKIAAVILALILVITVVPTDRDAAVYNDTIRLHILANSDKTEDQALKLTVRDKLLAKYSDELKSAHSKDEAKAEIMALSGAIKNDVDSWIKEAGYSYESRIELLTEWYDRREYDGFALPEGYYTSLQIKLGEADGQNWWCVMYPPLCLDIATEDAPADDALLGYNNETATLITSGRYTVRFKLLEIASELFSGGKNRS
ncbi:MAG: stage II sporulation protein R [Clostridia bacterium]|nr:stage II sporulation protein R [Clostridia bacterium]